MLKHLKSDESGVVLIMVLMVTIIIMIYSIGILSRSASQVVSSEDQVDRIRAEQLTIGAYAKAYTDMAAGSAMPGAFSANLDNKTFSVTVTDGGATGPINTNTLTISTNIPN